MSKKHLLTFLTKIPDSVFKTFSFGAYWSHNLEPKCHLMVDSGSNVIRNPLKSAAVATLAKARLMTRVTIGHQSRVRIRAQPPLHLQS